MAVPARAGLRFAGAIKEELRDPLTPVLAVGAVASAIVGSGFDTMLVAAVMGGNALISGVQRIRAERALRRLFSEQEIVARRLRRSRRDGTAAETVAGLEAVPLETVPASALSPGDVIALRASDVVPADARLLSAADLEVDESTLTGESIPVTKGVERVDVVCLDKTGTLTQGRLAVTGVTSFETDLERDHPRARRLLVTAARACPRVDPARIHTVPHATDRAVLEAVTGQGDNPENWRLRTELPFERPTAATPPRWARPATSRCWPSRARPRWSCPAAPRWPSTTRAQSRSPTSGGARHSTPCSTSRPTVCACSRWPNGNANSPATT